MLCLLASWLVLVVLVLVLDLVRVLVGRAAPCARPCAAPCARPCAHVFSVSLVGNKADLNTARQVQPALGV
jgi:hypothetical protein